jgi:5-methylcytosine-specific restriction endonuclease McrA
LAKRRRRKKNKQLHRGPKLDKFANPKLTKTGPNGRKLCRVCATEVKPPKRNYCSPECVKKWLWETRPNVRRRAVYLRDRGICHSCGIDVKTVSIRRARVEWNLPTSRKSVWDVDHILPLKLGGDHSLENLQTLCYLCHKTKTTTRDVPAIAENKRSRIKKNKNKSRRDIRKN